MPISSSSSGASSQSLACPLVHPESISFLARATRSWPAWGPFAAPMWSASVCGWPRRNPSVLISIQVPMTAGYSRCSAGLPEEGGVAAGWALSQSCPLLLPLPFLLLLMGVLLLWSQKDFGFYHVNGKTTVLETLFTGGWTGTLFPPPEPPHKEDLMAGHQAFAC